MGNVYYAQVDVFFDVPRAHWQAVSSWELQKDYEFSMALSHAGCAHTGFPPDVDLMTEETLFARLTLCEDFWDTYDLDNMRHVDGDLFTLVDFSEAFLWAQELQAHVKRLVDKGRKVRVLTWSL